MASRGSVTLVFAMAAAIAGSSCSREKREPPPPSGLPGPPGAAAAPRSGDPGAREVEERLFRTDGGRVLLKAIRAQGGWEAWMKLPEIRASVGEAGREKDRRHAFSPDAGRRFPADGQAELRRATLPFSLADPALKLEYLGVEVDSASGDDHDKVRACREEPGSSWSIAYFNRRTGLLDRALEPLAAGALAGGGPRFARIDLDDHRRAAGLLIAARWTFYHLPDRYARPDLKKPTRVELVQIEAASGAGGRP